MYDIRFCERNVIYFVNGTPQRLIIMMHGYHANGDNLARAMMNNNKRWDDALILYPDAITIGENGFGYQWYSLLDRKNMNQEIKAAGAILTEWIKDLMRHYNLNKVILGGFSQGGMLALHVGLHWLQTQKVFSIGGCTVSTDLPIFSPPPEVMLIHGEYDSVVLPQECHRSYTFCQQHGIKAKMHMIQNLDHDINAEVVELCHEFLLQ